MSTQCLPALGSNPIGTVGPESSLHKGTRVREGKFEDKLHLDTFVVQLGDHLVGMQVKFGHVTTNAKRGLPRPHKLPSLGAYFQHVPSVV